ncbi:M20/M25/M40 family metallo-hydrolase [Enterocloster lavalensis]|uniref:M20/M25/M40 family metallo-hydrolase n=1 Tax=Enterocloster lavalensis TaxID=460384 RepID=UPI000D1B6D8B|nr:M20/M25/M40 family metallo-hydrolase [Enterocloster lavalensis]PST34456.1 hypothetical protein C7256_05670 [Enterocloster lavalensis]
MGNLQQMFDYVDGHLDEMLGELGEACRLRSVAGDETGLEQTRAFIKEKWRTLGLDVREEPVEGGNAVLYSDNPGASDTCVLLYNHYDVVEEGKAGEWKTGDPFDAQVIDGNMYARGVSDNKGGLFCRIHALEAIRTVAGELPVRVKLFVEGDEEIGSPSMKKLMSCRPETYREMTKADLCIWEGGTTDDEGRPWVRYGVRGNCAFELSVKTAQMDCHGRMGAAVPSASWRLIWALSTLKTPDERIRIEGFYDDVVEATPADLEVLSRFPYEEEALKKRMGFEDYLLGVTGDELKRRIYMEPVVSVCGLEAGELYNGPRGIVPHKAMARISFYLVANQDPDRIHRLLREHLDRNGFSDVQVAYKGGSGAARTPVDMPFTGKLFEAARQVYDQPMVLELTQLGAGPAACFRKPWPDLPIVSVGTANGGSNHHAPNENIRVEDYRKAVKYMIALLYACGR